jgi:hypothetical protein
MDKPSSQPPGNQSANRSRERATPTSSRGAADRESARPSAARESPASSSSTPQGSGSLQIEPRIADGSDPSIGFDWRPTQLAASHSYGCVVTTEAGHALTVTVEQLAYKKTLRGTGCVELTVIPVAARGASGRLIARDETTGATAQAEWSWHEASGARGARVARTLRRLSAKLTPARLTGRTPEANQSVSAKPAEVVSQTTFFGEPARGQRFAFILDMSGSMAGRRWARCRAELATALGQLAPPAEFYVVLFSSSAVEPPDQTGWMLADATHVAGVLDWIASMRPSGGTYPRPAFERVFALPARPDAICFLTDGEISGFTARDCARLRETGTSSAIGSVLKSVRNVLRPDPEPVTTVVNTVSLDEDPSAKVLKAMADESGAYVHAKSQ